MRFLITVVLLMRSEKELLLRNKLKGLGELADWRDSNPRMHMPGEFKSSIKKYWLLVGKSEVC